MVLLACGPIWFTIGSLESRFLRVMCNKWRDLTASYYENHRTLEWARIFISLPHPLCFIAPPTFFDEFQEFRPKRARSDQQCMRIS